ncbi:hypothetical protein GCM10009560_59150 [Nonomuraea longicatena]|uniref:Uncharacterized protein n=1 Tax=Nonomuraea longicatena TaxID=83682 RepID=A0ABN1QND7_9ACTN
MRSAGAAGYVVLSEMCPRGSAGRFGQPCQAEIRAVRSLGRSGLPRVGEGFPASGEVEEGNVVRRVCPPVPHLFTRLAAALLRKGGRNRGPAGVSAHLLVLEQGVDKRE